MPAPSQLEGIRAASPRSEPRSESLRDVSRAITHALRPYRRRVVMLVGAATVGSVGEAAVLVLLVQLATLLIVRAGPTTEPRDAVVALNIHLTFTGVVVLAFAAIAVRALTQLLAAKLYAEISSRFEADQKARVIAAFLAATWPRQARARLGTLQDLATAETEVARWGIEAAIRLLSSTAFCVVLLLATVVIDPRAALIVTSAVAVMAAVVRPLVRQAQRAARARASETAEITTEVAHVVSLVREIRVFGVVDRFAAEIGRRINLVRPARLRTELGSQVIPALYQTASLSLIVAALAIVSWVNPRGSVATGSVVLVLVRLLTWTQAVQAAHGEVLDRLPHILRLRSEIESFEAAAETDRGRTIDSIESIAVHHVFFSYGEHLVLDDASFHIERGEHVAIIGASGSGKSTLLDIVLRLLEPERGTVLVNGIDSREITRASLATRIGYVPQHPQLVHGTIRANIQFFRPLRDSQVERAALRAGLGPDLQSLQLGLDSAVGDLGLRLSGGQRQRICLARALAGDPDLLVLDEPTSSIGVDAEGVVEDTLAECRGRIAVIVATHRERLARACDQLLVLTSGRLTNASVGEVPKFSG